MENSAASLSELEAMGNTPRREVGIKKNWDNRPGYPIEGYFSLAEIIRFLRLMYTLIFFELQDSPWSNT